MDNSCTPPLIVCACTTLSPSEVWLCTLAESSFTASSDRGDSSSTVQYASSRNHLSRPGKAVDDCWVA